MFQLRHGFDPRVLNPEGWSAPSAARRRAPSAPSVRAQRRRQGKRRRSLLRNERRMSDAHFRTAGRAVHQIGQSDAEADARPAG